jgi:cysteine-rich repeat protein
MLSTLATQAGCNCVIDPCPVMVRRTYDWSWSGRVARVDTSDVSRLTITTSGRLALIDAGDRDGLTITELVDARAGDSLAGGGRVVATFPGTYTLDPESMALTRFLLVRLVPSAGSVEAVAEWDIAGCVETNPLDPSVTTLSPVCGDGMAELPEQCDDENDGDGDGCTSCELDPGACTEAPATWAYWRCDGEPSACEQQRCDEAGTDPACDELTSVDVVTITDGLVVPTDVAGTVGSNPPGVGCTCAETAVSYECTAACAASVGPCATLSAAGSAAISFERWVGGCAGTEPCAISEATGPIVGVFASAEEGVDLERAYHSYPLTEPGLDLEMVSAGGGLVVAAGTIVGEFENPEAPDPPLGEAPRPFVVALDDLLEVAWSRDFVVEADGSFDLMGVAVDGAGNTVLVGALQGTLTLDSGAVTVEDGRQLVVVALDPTGVDTWSQLVTLPVAPAAPAPYEVLSARIASTADGTLAVAAVIDTGLTGTPLHDLVVATITSDVDGPAIGWVSRLRATETPVPVLAIDPSIGVAIDASGNVTVAGLVSGSGPFAWWLPDPVAPATDERRFVVRLSSTGSQLSSDPLPPSDAFDVQLAIDGDGRVVALTASHLVGYTADGELRWVEELTARPFDASPLAAAPVRRLAVDAASGEIVVSVDASTLALTGDAEEYLRATVTSRLSPEGEPLWTVRHGSQAADGSGEVFFQRGLVTVGDQVLVVGMQILPDDDPYADAAAVRRLAGGW